MLHDDATSTPGVDASTSCENVSMPAMAPYTVSACSWTTDDAVASNDNV
jgi:hypothetical protein